MNLAKAAELRKTVVEVVTQALVARAINCHHGGVSGAGTSVIFFLDSIDTTSLII